MKGWLRGRQNRRSSVIVVTLLCITAWPLRAVERPDTISGAGEDRIFAPDVLSWAADMIGLERLNLATSAAGPLAGREIGWHPSVAVSGGISLSPAFASVTPALERRVLDAYARLPLTFVPWAQRDMMSCLELEAMT
jgi:hypothetical protein